MASTLLSGLAEKMGFSNTPLRKLGLNQYLMGEYALDCGYMEGRLKSTLTEHAKPAMRGGVSVLDRDNQKPRSLVDIEKVRAQLHDHIEAHDVQDLYFKCRKLYLDAVTYKEVRSNPDWQIEMTVDIHRFHHKALFDAYQTHFDDVKMIHLHRPFDSWINSLASQAFVHPDLKQRMMFFPHMRYADYALYEDAVAAMPGLHIQFDEMFDTPIEKLAQNIADFADVPAPTCNLREDIYDMYGKAVPFEKAFTRFDDHQVFLKPKSRAYMQALTDKKSIHKIPHNISAWLVYLKDMFLYHSKCLTKYAS